MKTRLIQYRLVYPSVLCISRFYSLLSISRWYHDGELCLILVYFYVLGNASGLWFNHDLFTFVFISLNIQFFEKQLYSFLYCINDIIIIINNIIVIITIIIISIIIFIIIFIIISFIIIYTIWIAHYLIKIILSA